MVGAICPNMKKLINVFPFFVPLFGVFTGFIVCEKQELIVPVFLIFILAIFHITASGQFQYFRYFIYTTVLFAVLGAFRYHQIQSDFQQDGDLLRSSKHFKLTITQNLGKRKDWYRYECAVIEASNNGKYWNRVANANIDLYVKDSLNIDEGHQILLKQIHLVPFKKNQFPGEFDVQKLKYSRKFVGIFFAYSANFVSIKHHQSSLFAWRNQVKSFLNVSLLGGLSAENYQLVRQLIWGDKTQINEDLRSAFQISGTTHVLSVSGMHMALLFGFIHFILDKLVTHKKAKNYMKLLIVPILWVYAFLTGFSAPVLRAVSFFSYYLIGSVLFQRSLKLLHVLMVVGLLQLLYDPFVIYDIGFQLSYMAVLGLSTILPVLKQYYEHLPVSLRWLFDAFAISLSSTITTYPLILYYFHQFSVWFLLGNLLLLPMFTVLMYVLFIIIFLSMLSVSLVSVVSYVNIYLNWVSYLVKLSIHAPYPYVYAYGYDGIMMGIHFVFIFYLMLNFAEGWGFIARSVFVFLGLNFLFSWYYRFYRSENFAPILVHSKQMDVRVVKQGRTLFIHSEVDVRQKKITENIEFISRAYAIDTVVYSLGNKPK